MVTLQQFVATSYLLVKAARWKELAEYFSLVRELLERPSMVIVPGTPIDKELK